MLVELDERRFLLDPGYLVAEPIPLRPGRAVDVNMPGSRLEYRPVAGRDEFDLSAPRPDIYSTWAEDVGPAGKAAAHVGLYRSTVSEQYVPYIVPQENGNKEDVRWLGFDWRENLRHASDYFEAMYGFAVELIKKGLAYVCTLSPEAFKAYRGVPGKPGMPSPHRDRAVEENLDLFERMHGLLTGAEGSRDDLQSFGKLAALSGVREYPTRVKCASLCWHTMKSALTDGGSVTTE